MGSDEQKSWNDGDALAERVESKGDEKEEAGRGPTPLDTGETCSTQPAIRSLLNLSVLLT